MASDNRNIINYNDKDKDKDNDNENEYEYENEYENEIRQPDKVIKEILIEEDFDENFYKKEIEEKELNMVINLSINEFNKQNELNIKFEEEILNNYCEIYNKRKEIFSHLIIKLVRLSNFDIKIKEIYEILEIIIDSYCSQSIEFTELDKNTFDSIFNLLYSIRIDKHCMEILKNIIICI